MLGSSRAISFSNSSYIFSSPSSSISFSELSENDFCNLWLYSSIIIEL